MTTKSQHTPGQLLAENERLRDALELLCNEISHTENVISGLAIPGMSGYFDDLRALKSSARAALAKAQS